MDFDYSITYRLFTELDNNSPSCFINKYKADIMVVKPSGEDVKIGQMVFDIVLLNHFLENGLMLKDICQANSELCEFSKLYFDFETEEFNDRFNHITNNSIMLGDFCIIKEFKLLPGFRGKGIGPKILKDLYLRFSSSIDLIVIKSTPFQLKKKHYNDIQHSDEEFLQAMTFDDLEFDEETAQLKLNAFFQRLGFKYLDLNYFYLDTRIRQPKIMAC